MDHGDFHSTSLPIIQTETFQVARSVTLDETARTRTVLTFPRDLFLFRQTQCFARVTLAGEEIKRSSLYSDCDMSLMCSVRDPLDLAARWAKGRYANLPGTTVEAVLQVSEFYGVPYTPTEEQLRFRSAVPRTHYRDVPSDWLDVTRDDALHAVTAWSDAVSFDERFRLGADLVWLHRRSEQNIANHLLYSSALSDDANFAAFGSILSEIAPPGALSEERIKDRIDFAKEAIFSPNEHAQ